MFRANVFLGANDLKYYLYVRTNKGMRRDKRTNNFGQTPHLKSKFKDLLDQRLFALPNTTTTGLIHHHGRVSNPKMGQVDAESRVSEKRQQEIVRKVPRCETRATKLKAKVDRFSLDWFGQLNYRQFFNFAKQDSSPDKGKVFVLRKEAIDQPSVMLCSIKSAKTRDVTFVVQDVNNGTKRRKTRKRWNLGDEDEKLKRL